MSQEKIDSIKKLVESGEIEDAILNFKEIISASELPDKDKDSFLDEIIGVSSMFKKSEKDFLAAGIKKIDDHQIVQNLSTISILNILKDFQRALEDFESTRKKREYKVKEEAIISRVKTIIFISIAIGCFYYKDHLILVVHRFFSTYQNAFIEVVTNGGKDEITKLDTFESIFTPTSFYSIVFSFLFYQSYLLLYYVYKLTSINSALKIKNQKDSDIKWRKFKLYLRYIILVLFSLFIGYFINNIFDKDVIRDNIHLVQLSTHAIFFLPAMLMVPMLLAIIDGIGKKIDQSDNLMLLFSVMICFVLYHGYCSYKEGILSKNVIFITEKVSGMNINSPMKEFLDFTNSIFKSENDGAGKNKK